MPELPEVETTCRGIRPYLNQSIIRKWIVRESRLRWPVPEVLSSLPGQTILDVQRRAKYLLIHCTQGHILIHLGMSGSLRIVPPETPWRKHDHLALELSNNKQLRYHDPRRFGCWLWTTDAPALHPLLRTLGPEPLSEEFTASLLQQRFRTRNLPIKQAIMDARTVVGVGNIYACEALFLARIDPQKPARQVSRKKLELLVSSIREVLEHSILQGGTTLRDFLREDGTPGYFSQQLRVYGRENLPCQTCSQSIKKVTLGQRSTFYCPQCQK